MNKYKKYYLRLMILIMKLLIIWIWMQISIKINYIKEMKEAANTLNHWKKEILNSFVWIKNIRIPSGPIEEKIIT